MFIFFSSFFCVKQGSKGHEGRYMALFTMSFSLAHIASSKTGLTIIDAYGYQANWFVMGSLGILGASCIWLQKLVQKKTIPIVNLWAPPLLKGQTNELLTQPLSAMLSGYTLWRIAAIPHAAPFPEQRICIKNLPAPKSTPKRGQTD
jgi:hypothetical protein